MAAFSGDGDDEGGIGDHLGLRSNGPMRLRSRRLAGVTVQPVRALAVHLPAFPAQQDVDTPLATTGLLCREIFDPRLQVLVS
jgi:hypothetical protein